MRPINVLLSAAGNSPWVPINELQNAFGIGLGGSISSGASLTWTVQHTFDESGTGHRRSVIITRVTTVATVVDTAHGLSIGDSVIVIGSGSTNLDGTYDVASVVDANTYTYTVVNTGAAAGGDNTRLNSFRVYPHATLVGQVGRADGNYAFPVQCIRLRCPTYVSGKVDLTILQAIGR